MTIQATCSACKRTYAVEESWVGRRAACRACGRSRLPPPLRPRHLRLPQPPSTSPRRRQIVRSVLPPAPQTPPVASARPSQTPTVASAAVGGLPPPLPRDTDAGASPTPRVRFSGISRKWVIVGAIAVAGCLFVVSGIFFFQRGSDGRGTRESEAAALSSLSTRGRPGAVQDAIRLYEEGKYGEAYQAAKAYIDKGEEHAVNISLRTGKAPSHFPICPIPRRTSCGDSSSCFHYTEATGGPQRRLFLDLEFGRSIFARADRIGFPLSGKGRLGHPTTVPGEDGGRSLRRSGRDNHGCEGRAAPPHRKVRERRARRFATRRRSVAALPRTLARLLRS